MVSRPPTRLPSTTELPCSDDIPVDNEDQNLLPNLLLFVLASLWTHRMDWYFGVDMAVYHTTGVNPRVPVVPDAFLSLGVERRKTSQAANGQTQGQSKGRLSYAVWEEGGVAPMLALEMVSKTPGGEYDEKLEIYRRLGVLYYAVYNPAVKAQDGHQPFELYKLVDGPKSSTYQQQLGEPYWMPEIGLGLGRAQQLFGGIEMEVLLWYDKQGQPYPIPEEELRRVREQLAQQRQRAERAEQRAERAEQQTEAQRQRAELAEQRAVRFAEQLRSLGIDPDNLPEQN